MHKRTCGFTLIELCIVLTVVGLLVGGTLAGRNLVRAAEIRSVLNDTEKWQSAIQQFRSKYRAMPGDMKNATQFWGAVAGGTAIGIDATCQAYFDSTHTPVQATCNGDGDGKVERNGNNWNEPWRLWQHLADAGMIQGMYTGQGSGPIGGGGSSVPKDGLSAPSSRVNSLTYLIMWEDAVTASDLERFAGDYGNTMRIGQKSEVDGSVMSASEAFSLDSKFDDGAPGTGAVRSYKNSRRPGCASTDDPLTATYQNRDDIGCNLLIIIP